MAKATVQLAPVTLELTPDEAQFLRDLLANYVSGDPHKTRRRHSDAIISALGSVGYGRGLMNDARGSSIDFYQEDK